MNIVNTLLNRHALNSRKTRDVNDVKGKRKFKLNINEKFPDLPRSNREFIQDHPTIAQEPNLVERH